MIYRGHSIPLDRSFKLSSEFDDFLTKYAKEIIEKSGGASRIDAINNIRNALSVILGNLFRLSIIHPDLALRIDRSNDGYPKGPFNPYRLNPRAIRSVVQYLEQHHPPLLFKSGGNYDRVANIGYATKIVATNHMIELIISFFNKNAIGLSKELSPSQYNNTITRNTFTNHINIDLHDHLFMDHDLPTIRMKDRNKKYAEFEQDNKIMEMAERLDKYNGFLRERHWIDLFLTNNEFSKFYADQRYSNENCKSSGCIDLISGRSLYRVFNDGTFDHGGRFYGGWWQGIPKAYRQFITINGIPTVELDFSNMQISMLYARVGYQLEGDAYFIEGIDGQYRALIKEATLKLINAQDRMQPPVRSSLPPGWTWKGLQEAIAEKHKPIADYFRSGEGIRLQRIDADIAENVLMQLMGAGVLALPIHDSFIVAEGNAERLRNIMLEAYKAHMNGSTVQLKTEKSLLDALSEGHHSASASERRKAGLAMFREKAAQPEYSCFRERQESFPLKRTDTEPASTTGDIQTGPTNKQADVGILGRYPSMKRLWDRLTAH